MRSPYKYAIENYGTGSLIYGIAVTAKFPIPGNSKLTYYERHNGTITLADSIEGATVPYPIDYYFYYSDYSPLFYDTSTVKFAPFPCFLYLFDSPHKGVDTFYVGLNASYSTWQDTNQIYLYGTVLPIRHNWNDGQTFMVINEDYASASSLTYLYQRITGMNAGELYPLVGLPCTAPQPPTVSVVGDSLRLEWDNVGRYYQMSFKNTDLGNTALVTDTLADNHHTLADSIFASGNYEVRLRKACRYTTVAYDTLMWSDWSDPAAFAVSSSSVITPMESSHNLSFSLFPNPASGSVSIMLNEPSSTGNEELQLTILDIHGREITSVSHQPGKVISLDLGTFSSGTYLLRITTPVATATRRLVVQ